MNSFRKPIPVIKRLPGTYVKGIWTVPPEPQPVSVLATVQPVGNDKEIMQIQSYGREFHSAWKIYTNEPLRVAGELGGYPGDFVLFNGRRLLLVGLTDRHMLNTEVSHYRYFAIDEIEKGEGEQPS